MNEKEFDIEFKNKIKNFNLKVPSIVSERIDETLSFDLPNKKVHKFKVNKILKYTLTAACLALIVLIASINISPTIASALNNIPIINSVFQFFGDNGLKLAKDKEISSSINQTKVANDISITLTDILCDGSRMSIGYMLKGTDAIFELEKPNIFVDGNPIKFSSNTSGNMLDKTSFAGVLNITPESKLPNSFKLSITFNKVGAIEGDWSFKNIKVITQEDKLNGKILNAMITKPLHDGSITVEKLFISDSTINLSVIESNLPKDKYYDYQLLDSFGNVLEPMGGGGSGKDNISKGQYQFVPRSNESKYYTIKVIERELKNESAKDIKTDLTKKLPINIYQDTNILLSINKVEYLKDKALIYYTYNGNNPYGNGMCIWVEDEFGNRYDNLQKPILRKEDGTCILECIPLNPNRNYKIGSRELKDLAFILEFQIPIE